MGELKLELELQLELLADVSRLQGVGVREVLLKEPLC